MASLLDYAQLADTVYQVSSQNRTPVPSGWNEIQYAPNDPITGFSAGVYQSSSEIVISYTGTDQSSWKDFVNANVPAALGSPHSSESLWRRANVIGFKQAGRVLEQWSVGRRQLSMTSTCARQLEFIESVRARHESSDCDISPSTPTSLSSPCRSSASL